MRSVPRPVPAFFCSRPFPGCSALFPRRFLAVPSELFPRPTLKGWCGTDWNGAEPLMKRPTNMHGMEKPNA